LSPHDIPHTAVCFNGTILLFAIPTISFVHNHYLIYEVFLTAYMPDDRWNEKKQYRNTIVQVVPAKTKTTKRKHPNMHIPCTQCRALSPGQNLMEIHGKHRDQWRHHLDEFLNIITFHI